MSWGAVGAAAVTTAGSLVSSSNAGSNRSPAERIYYSDIFPRARALLDRTPDQIVAGISPQLQQLLDYMGIFGGPGGVAGQRAGAADALGQYATGGFRQGLENLSSPVQVGTPDLGVVGSLASNPFVDSMVTAALRDPYRNLTENTLPGINQAAAATGNVGSTRQGVAEGIARRGYADSAADVGASIRGGLYQNALGIESNRQSLISNLNLNRNLSLLGLGGLGLNASQVGQGLDLQGFDTAFNAGQYLRNHQQNLLDAPILNLQQIGQLLLAPMGAAPPQGAPPNAINDALGTGLGVYGALRGIMGSNQAYTDFGNRFNRVDSATTDLVNNSGLF